MIHYQLQCDSGHGFDGWFAGSDAFEKQAKAGLLECPICGDAKVTRALMTPGVPRKGNSRTSKEVVPAAKPQPKSVAGTQIPDQVRAALQRLRAEVESTCDYVGDDFAEEARRIHRGESEKRGIYGEASDEQAESLAEDGIQVARMPWVPRADS